MKGTVHSHRRPSRRPRTGRGKAELFQRARTAVSRIEPETWRFLYSRVLEDLGVIFDLCRKSEGLREPMPASEGAMILVCLKDIWSIASLITETPRDRLVFTDHAPMDALVRELFTHQITDDLRVMELMITLSSRKAAYPTIPLDLVENIHRRARAVKCFLDRVSAVARPVAPELQASPTDEEFRRLYASFNDGLAFMDSRGVIVEANPAFQKLLGYGETEIKGMAFRDLTAPKWQGLEDSVIHERLTRQGRTEEYDKECVRKDGSLIQVSAKVWVGKDEHGVVSGLWAIVRDITERKRAEDILAEDSFRTRLVLQKMSDGVTVSDPSGRFEVFNDRMREITGYSVDEANAAKDFASLIHPDPSERSAALAKLNAVPRGGHPLESETVITAKNGTRKDLLVSTSVIGFRGRDMFLSVWRDITERKRAEERVARQAALLRGIVEVLQSALSAPTVADLGRTCLSVAEEITGSRFGLILELNAGGAMDSLALSDPGWGSCRMPVKDAAVMLKDIAVRGIWAPVVREGRSIIVNDPATRPERVGTPPGHPPILCFLGVPLMSAGRTAGIIGLANKDGGYAEADRHDLETLASVFVEALARKEAQDRFDHLWNIIESSVNEIYVFDPVTLRFQHANLGALKNTGYTLEELRKLTPLDLKPDFDEESFMLMTAPLLKEEKKDQVFQTVHRRKDGSLYDVEVHLQLVRHGEQQSFVAIILDITETQRMRHELRLSEKRCKRLFETAEDGMLILDEESGAILDANPCIQDMLGHGREDMTGLKLWEIGLFPGPEDAEEVLAELVDKGRARREGLAVPTKEGRELIVELSAHLFESDRRQAVHCTVRDVTLRRQAEEKIREVVDAKAKFASMVSHELRTPLTVIKECVYLLAESFSPSPTGQQGELVEICQRNITRLTRLINNVLDYQSAASGGMKYELKENDLNAVAREVGQAMAPLAAKKGLALSVTLDRDVPILIFDRDKITQALTNLVANAVRCTEQGKVEIATAVEDGTVHVMVRDTGRGIAENDLPKLFQSFQRLGERSEGGTGLGLAITKQIVEQHSGRIWAESEPGKGSVFQFVLPVLKNR